MRLFCGLDLTPGITGALSDLVRRLRPAARLHWSPVENLHITTKFIGEWPAGRLDDLKHALQPLASREPIPLDVRGLGWFPNPHPPRIFWAGLVAPPALAALARDTDVALSRLGIEPEKRPFSPHLTLARIKSPVPLTELQRRIAALDSVEFGSFTADAFHLYLSDRRPEGSVYSKLATFPFHQP